jgi:exodeoxyribonuclease V
MKVEKKSLHIETVVVGRWLRDGDQQVFRLFGYAGTGKTTLAKHITAGVDGHAVFVAPTGKAAAVMRDSGCCYALAL